MITVKRDAIVFGGQKGLEEKLTERANLFVVVFLTCTLNCFERYETTSYFKKLSAANKTSLQNLLRPPTDP